MDRNHVRPKEQGVNRRSQRQVIEGKETCFFYTSDTGKTADKVFQLALKIANESASDNIRITALASLICLVVPGFKDDLLSILENLGIEPEELSLPSNLSKLGAMSVDFDVELDWPIVQLYFGCIVLLLFKNINQGGYQDYMRKRIRAMQGVRGLNWLPPLSNPFNFRAANTIRVRFGSLSPFKGEVIGLLLNEFTKKSKSSFHHLATYLLGFLAWSDMYCIKCIFDTLVQFESPILNDPRIQHEAINVNNAVEEICKAKCPQFYPYFEGLNNRSILDKSKFPILFAVAQKIEKRRQSLAGTRTNNFSIQGGQENELVTALYNDHVAAEAKGPPPPIIVEAIHFLFNMEWPPHV